ncbi:MAG: PAS domain S-box protein, partial [Gammaproteobacteria bacterium]|nr:PAS domain S-box protein [Gammaproteobacteria bacterium]
MDAGYETFLAEAPIWVAAMDAEGVCRGLSAAWLTGLGVDSNSELALPLVELLASDESATINAVMDAIKTQSVIHAMPTRLAVPMGSVEGYLSAWPAAIGDDARTIIFVSFTDQQLEAELAQLRRHEDLILEAAGEGIYGLDNQGCTTFVNQAATQILGWRAEDVLGQPLHGIHHHSYPDGSPYPRDECPIYAAFKDGKIHREDTEVFWHSDGTAIPVEYTSTPIRENGELTGAVVVFRDISERRGLEQQREQDFHEISHLKEQLELERDYLRDEIRVTSHYRDIIGDSQALQRTLAQIEA